ncbi:MAG: hypothetical protein ACM3YN_07295 [Parcubacteria group bacterium]
MRASRIFLVASTLLVVTVVIIGVYLMGSPRQARVRGLDRQRIQTLTQLSNAFDGYGYEGRPLPKSLQVLAGERPGIEPADLRDPETGAPYEYRATSARSYELCARFGGSSAPDEAIRWAHGPGRKCFQFTLPEAR